MLGNIDGKIIGAFTIGIALVGGAYTFKSMNRPDLEQQATLGIETQQAAPRVAIAISDNDNNGIEDWRDVFVVSSPAVINTSTTSKYVPPQTLTGQMGIEFIEGVLNSRIYAPFGPTEDEVLTQTVKKISANANYKLYDTADISIIENWNDTDVLNYANAMGGFLIESNLLESENELSIMYDITRRDKDDRLVELEQLSNQYRQLRNLSLLLPVPAAFAKQHLDIINTYHAVHKDIEAMAVVNIDPVITLTALNRYPDDNLGLIYAMQNMYGVVSENNDLFTASDSASIFAKFNPNQNNP